MKRLIEGSKVNKLILEADHEKENFKIPGKIFVR